MRTVLQIDTIFLLGKFFFKKKTTEFRAGNFPFSGNLGVQIEILITHLSCVGNLQVSVGKLHGKAVSEVGKLNGIACSVISRLVVVIFNAENCVITKFCHLVLGLTLIMPHRVYIYSQQIFFLLSFVCLLNRYTAENPNN